MFDDADEWTIEDDASIDAKGDRGLCRVSWLRWVQVRLTHRSPSLLLPACYRASIYDTADLRQ